MNVSLTTELEKFIQTKVDSKMYQTASEVVREALRLMKREEEFDALKLSALRTEIEKSITESERGAGRTFDGSVAAQIKARGRQRLRLRRETR